MSAGTVPARVACAAVLALLPLASGCEETGPVQPFCPGEGFVSVEGTPNATSEYVLEIIEQDVLNKRYQVTTRGAARFRPAAAGLPLDVSGLTLNGEPMARTEIQGPLGGVEFAVLRTDYEDRSLVLTPKTIRGRGEADFATTLCPMVVDSPGPSARLSIRSGFTVSWSRPAGFVNLSLADTTGATRRAALTTDGFSLSSFTFRAEDLRGLVPGRMTLSVAVSAFGALPAPALGSYAVQVRRITSFTLEP